MPTPDELDRLIEQFDMTIPSETAAGQSVQERIVQQLEQLQYDERDVFGIRLAIEEALVNAVYHRSYEEREPIEVRIYPDKILIISYPGPLPPLGKNNINKPIVTSHRYRNSRLGDCLKELELTEGRCTGFPKNSSGT